MVMSSMKSILLAPVLAVILAVSVVGGVALFSSGKLLTGGTAAPEKAISGGVFAQDSVPPTPASRDVQAIGSGLSSPSLLTTLFIVVGVAALFGGASAILSRRASG